MHTLAQLLSGELAGARRLDLCEDLVEFPREIFELADTLEVLNLTGNQLTTLPADLHRLHRLQVIFCSDNAFTRLPDSLGACPRLSIVGFKANRIEAVSADALPAPLRWLILTDNRITALPDALGQRPRLQKLMLAGNRLTELPSTLQDCEHLALLRISANAFDTLPAWLPDMPRLAWLAYAGNPCTQSLEEASLDASDVAQIAWDQLTLRPIPLGQGASGVIHQAVMHAHSGELAVAVKLFKGQMTSDGLPRSEMAAWLASGQHPALIAVQGVLKGHPHGTQGVVMPLIEPVYEPLAEPPSLTSCTRDVYAPDRSFSVPAVFRAASRLAGAGAHLHQRGMIHGDFYAHNILWHAQGNALLGDFGAATFLPEHDEALSIALQKVEVRAFGLLLQELTTRCRARTPAEETLLLELTRLQAQCLDERPSQRPLLKDVSAAMASAGAD